ncbi:MAG: hypothetical protein U0T69_07515 [Chitinophagales bacterium]
MKRTHTIITVFVLLLLACSNPKTTADTREITTISKNDTQIISSTTEEENLQLFSNIEQIEYCIPLPLNEYKETFTQDNERAKHTFLHKTKKDNEINVQGFFREDMNVSLENYFDNTFADAEEEGKIILEKKLLKDNNCFYATGYWSNSIYDFRFTEIYWLRKEEMIKLSSTYNINDTTLWNSRREQIMKANSWCN